MASLAFGLAFLALFYSPKTETNGQIITVSVELHTTVGLPCRCPIFPESTALVQWYRSSNSGVFVKEGKTLASWSIGINGSAEGYGITDDFTMMIYNLTNQHDQKLYRCILTPVGGAAQCTHDVKLGIYAYPDSSPVIEYIRQTSGFNVTCSISNVFPMTFPILTTKGRNGTAYTNRDGTYNTTVTRLISPTEKDTTIECLYSNLNFKSKTLLRIVDSDTIDQNTTHTDFRCTLSGLWIVYLIITLYILCFIFIVLVIKCGCELFDPTQNRRENTDVKERVAYDRENSEEDYAAKSERTISFTRCELFDPTQNRRENTDVKERVANDGENNVEDNAAKSERIISFARKLFYVVITMTILIAIVFLLLVAYLATARY